MDYFLPNLFGRFYARHPAALWLTLIILTVATFAALMLQSNRPVVVYQGF